jgi:hypothetical protein
MSYFWRQKLGATHFHHSMSASDRSVHASKADSRHTRIVTWNANAISTILQYHPFSSKATMSFVMDWFEADILCIQVFQISLHHCVCVPNANLNFILNQETKLSQSRLTEALCALDRFDSFWSFCQVAPSITSVAKKTGSGYSGVATFVRKDSCLGTPVAVEEGTTQLNVIVSFLSSLLCLLQNSGITGLLPLATPRRNAATAPRLPCVPLSELLSEFRSAFTVLCLLLIKTN